MWSEEVPVPGAVAVLEYANGGLDGQPAGTRHDLASGGRTWYVSADLEAASMDALILRIADDAGVEPILRSAPPEGLEVTIRETPEKRFLFLLNHGQTTVAVDPTTPGDPTDWRRIGADPSVDGSLDVPAGDVVILVANQERTSVAR